MTEAAGTMGDGATVDQFDESLLPLWPDNPAKIDLLGFADVARPIVSAIRRERLNPVSIGLSGPWGSGKSTVLDLVHEQLEAHAAIIPVRTSPWAYDPKLDVRATLIGDVLDEIRRRAEEETTTGEALKKKLRDLAGKVRWSKAFALAAKTALTVQVPNWDAIEGVFKLGDGDDTSSERDPTLSGFKAEFAAVLEELKTVDRVVVLVDDLDRCLPEAVIATLEAIKLFLSVDKMAFVIAYDRAPVIEAVRIRYQGATDPGMMASQYLEKIIQVPVSVPRLGEDEVTTYLAVTMLEPLIPADDLTAIITNASTRRATGERPLLDGHELTLAGTPAERVALARRLAPVVFDPFQGNPRRLKRFLNDYWMRAAIARARGAGLEPDALAKLMVLEQVHEDEFKELVTWAAQGVVREKLAAVESGQLTGIENWATPQLKRWAELEPPLADTSLRPYLELAATLLAIPFTGLGLPANLAAILIELRDPSPGIRKAGQAKAKALDGESRVLLAEALIKAVPSSPGRQGDLAEAIPDLVNGDDAVGRTIVNEVRRLAPSMVEPALVARLNNCNVASTNAFIEEIRRDPLYDDGTAVLAPPQGA